MNYGQQERYLRSSRVAAWAVLALLLGAAAACMASSRRSGGSHEIVFCLIMVVLAISLCYTPDYLHLTVNPEKRARWEVKIRWRIIPSVLIVSLLLSSNVHHFIVSFIAAGWLAACNFAARKIISLNYLAAYFWLTDLVLLGFLILGQGGDLLLACGLFAAAAHLSVVVSERRPLLWAAVVTVSGWALMLPILRAPDLHMRFSAGPLLLVAAMGTGWLVWRSQGQNSRNVAKAMRELMEFNGYSGEKVVHLWTASDKQLAQNWMQATPDERDSKALAEWYRQNSELYMFAISGYNLDYKRIRSNLKVLGNARGACLDYGAGNGEIVLELARRGHAATYYDVEGASAKFAQQRAQRQGLQVKFRYSKETLAAEDEKFDTIFSLDVLEHLPDLAAELSFLSGLLRPGGLLLFDVPAGTTKSHPMHLNHDVDFRTLLTKRGLREKRSWWRRLPFVKQEKFLFMNGG